MTTMTILTILGLIASHAVVAYMAFQLGGLAAANFAMKELDKISKKVKA